MYKCRNARFLVNNPAVVKSCVFRLSALEQFTRAMIIIAEAIRTIELLFLKFLPFASP